MLSSTDYSNRRTNYPSWLTVDIDGLISPSSCGRVPLRLSWIIRKEKDKKRTRAPSSNFLAVRAWSILPDRQPGCRSQVVLLAYHRAADRKPRAITPGRLSILALIPFLYKPHNYPADTCIAKLASRLVEFSLVEDEGCWWAEVQIATRYGLG